MNGERSSLSDLHRTIQENMHTINMTIKSSDYARQTAIPKDHHDLLQFHIDLSLISTDKNEKIKKLENVRRDIDHSIQLFQQILKLQNDRSQDSLLDAEVVNFVLQLNCIQSNATNMFQNLTQKDLANIVERLEAAKTRLFDIAHKDGLKLQPCRDIKKEEEAKINKLMKMRKELIVIEETLEENMKSMEELKIIISEKIGERNNLKKEIERLETVDLGKGSICIKSLTSKKKSLHSQIVVHYDLTNCIEYKREVERDDNSKEVHDALQEIKVKKL